MIFDARVSSEGKLKFGAIERTRFDVFVATLAGKVVTVAVELEADRRSKEANSYWFGAVVEFFRKEWSRERRTPAGLPEYTKDEAHEIMVQIILGFEDGPKGSRVRKKTRDLTPADFSKLIEDGRAMAWHDYQANIPDSETWKSMRAEGSL